MRAGDVRARDARRCSASRSRHERAHPFRCRAATRMVDVSRQGGDRAGRGRRRRACVMRPETLALIEQRRRREGRRAGGRAARRHHGRQAHRRADPALPPAGADLRSRSSWPARRTPAVEITATCRVTGRTGVEMEALTAVERRRADRLRHVQGGRPRHGDHRHPAACTRPAASPARSRPPSLMLMLGRGSAGADRRGASTPCRAE